MHEVRTDAAWPFLVQNETFGFDARQPADSRADRTAGAKPHIFRHVEKTGVLNGLSGRVEPVDDEGIDLSLDLVVDASGWIEAIFVVGWLHLARDAAFLVAGIELRDRTSATLRRNDVLPARLDVASERRHKTETRHHDTAHRFTPNATGSNPVGLSLSKPCTVLQRFEK